jgi:hypothetical protein
MRHPSIVALAVLAAPAVLAGCTGRPRVADAPACQPSWRAEWNGDSTLALCLPMGFTRRDGNTWTRPRPGSAALDFLTVEVVRWPEDSVELRTWPPQLAAPGACYADCGRADSVTLHSDRVTGVSAHTETALLSGGATGLRRAPFLVMGWTMSERHRGFAQGSAAQAATLDSLREAVRSLRVGRAATIARAAA